MKLTNTNIWKESFGCWEKTGIPCPDIIRRCADSGEEAYETIDSLRNIRRDTVDRPVLYIGAGTCGLGAGAARTLAAMKEYCAEKGIDADIVEVGCIGLCVEEPLLDVQLPGKARVCFSRVTEKDVPGILDGMFGGTVPEERLLGQHRTDTAVMYDDVPVLDEHPFFAPQTRWVLSNCGIVDPNSIDEYIARGGYRAFATVVNSLTPREVCDVVEKSGLRGRGGGGFPAGKKWHLTLREPGDQKYMICNADEGDPGAFMDRAVIEGDPYRLLEGLSIAAYATGSSKAYVYIRAEYPLAIQRLKHAMAEARKYGLLGYNILDSGFNLEIKIKKGAGAFVCGEETALIHSIEGKRGMPRPRPPYPSVRGLFDKPTTINNVETLANVPHVMLAGEDGFGAVGTGNSKGTKVFALSGKISRTGLVEIAMGTTIRELIFDIGGGVADGRKFKAVQIGGPSGGCLVDEHLDIPIDYESLREVGAMMGSGGMVVMDEDTCMVDVAKYFMDFIQRESCGKCIPCREGTKRMLEILTRITSGRRGEKDTAALERFKGVMSIANLAEVIKDTSLCGLGQSAPNPVLSTLRLFRDEYEAHIYERRCPAKVCNELLTFSIDNDTCVGCTACAKQCPADAIVGTAKSPHYIIDEKCIGCGSCVEACRFDAIHVE